MEIPVYLITGSLDAGKTTFLNNILKKRRTRALVFQFEDGEEAFSCAHRGHRSIIIPRRQMEQQPGQTTNQIYGIIQTGGWEEIWVEWNGAAPFSWLLSMFWGQPLCEVCCLKKVIYIADAVKLEALLAETWNCLSGQIAESDMAVIRGYPSQRQYRRICRLLKEGNSDIDIIPITSRSIYKKVLREPDKPVSTFLLELIVIVCLIFLAGIISGTEELPVGRMVSLFWGMTLQALPFLLLGILLSSAIQILIPQGALERWFPKSLIPGTAVALAGGFLLPVCDCVSVPVFKSLVKQGVPLSAAITFMMAAPVMNPVVLLSTFYAFGGNMKVVAGRAVTGALAAVIIGVLAAAFQRESPLISGRTGGRFLCACGCSEDSLDTASVTGKGILCLRHAQMEFFSVGWYLLMGVMTAAVFQTFGAGQILSAGYGMGPAGSILFMIMAAFVLSLCSSSDATIARSFASQFPASAVMAFLIFGPMMDLKNVLMLSGGFTKGFMARLLLLSVSVCFLLAFFLYGAEGIRI